ncbi:RNA 2',3'-cyclic phosphodiesterase [Agrococcus citreus]|uniref:RNA 2',3'-cyclic phosphodiesterase n=2 Tax=Agrococcus citreus TaxID=84643 RepID=A0ABN1YR74_9MICO
MFVAVVPPADVREDLAEFLDPREGLRWTPVDRLHLTLGFLPDVSERILEPLDERLRAALLDLPPFDCRLSGAGAFPDADRPAVLWMGVDRGRAELEHLAQRVRTAASVAGAFPDGQRFVPHVTLARPPRHRSAIRWLRMLDTYASRTWTIDEVSLIESQLRGRPHHPRHVEISVLPLGG